MICENCNIEYSIKYGSGRFCSQKCARSYSTKQNRDLINSKVSKALLDKQIAIKHKLKCALCQIEFEVSHNKRDQIYCSFSCSSKDKWNDVDFRENMSNLLSKAAHRRHDANEDFGWRTRSKFDASYPELIAMKILDDLQIEYTKEFRVGKYFIDFAILNKKIAIEIDGRQHSLPERILSDNKKDEFLKQNDWKIFRIKWPNDLIKEKIIEILKTNNLYECSSVS